MWVFVTVVFALLHGIQITLRVMQKREIKKIQNELVQLQADLFYTVHAVRSMAILTKQLTHFVVSKLGHPDEVKDGDSN